jgi:hypothetical protein
MPHRGAFGPLHSERHRLGKPRDGERGRYGEGSEWKNGIRDRASATSGAATVTRGSGASKTFVRGTRPTPP